MSDAQACQETPRGSPEPKAGAEGLVRVREAVEGMRLDMSATVLTIVLSEIAKAVPAHQNRDFQAAVLGLLAQSLDITAAMMLQHTR